MAGWFFGPILEKIRSSCFDYLEDQLVLHTDMKEALERLQKLHPKIQSVIFACNQDQIIDPALNRWLWQLRDAIDEADDVLDDFEYMKHEEQLTKNNDETKLLPNIPASPEVLNLSDLEALQCLPSSLSTSSLKRLHLTRIPLLKSLPDLPPGLKSLSVHNCHRKLMKQYQSFHTLISRRLLTCLRSIYFLHMITP